MIEFKNPTKLDIIKGLFLRHVLKREVIIYHDTFDRKFMRNNWLCLLLKKL